MAQSHRCPGCELVELERENVPETAKGVRIRLVPYAQAGGIDDGVS